MTLRKAKTTSCPPTADRNSCALELPSHWTLAQVTAVFEVLDDLRELVWQNYGRQIQQVLRRDRAIKMSSIPADIEDGDVPF